MEVRHLFVAGLAGVLALDLLNKYRQLKQLEEQNNQLESLKLSQPQGQSARVPEPLAKHKSISQYLVYRICITGGPQSGRTTALTTVRDYLTEKGYQVFIVPSIKKFNINPDVSIENLSNYTASKRLKMLALHIKVGLDIFNYYLHLTSLVDRTTVILSEGGLLDDTVDFTDNDWEKLQEIDGRICKSFLRDKLYQAVIHLVTSADDDVKEFIIDKSFNSPSANEQIQSAIRHDQKLQTLWQGNPSQVIIDNKGGFDKKIDRVVEAAQQIVGLPVTKFKYRKYQVNQILYPVYLNTTVTYLTDTYLTQAEPNEVERIRVRRTGNQIIYQHIIRNHNQQDKSFREIKRPISATAYVQLLKRRDKAYVEFQRQRTSFVWENVPYVVDSFEFKGRTYGIIRVHDNESIPRFVNVMQEVTEDPNFDYLKIAKELKRENV